jgi:hypothetical protein
MRGRIVAGALGLGCAGLTVLTLVTPAAGERYGPGRMPAGNVAADCEDASMNTPRGGSGAVKLTTDVPDGATVGPGEDILLRLTWDPSRWTGPQLDRALDCVRVKGELAPDLSAEEAPTANDGVFEYRLHVPDDIRPGCDVCAEGFVAGQAAGGPQQLRTERHCFMSGPPRPPTPPVTRPPTPPATTPPTMPVPLAPPTPPTTAVVAPVRIPAAVPTDVGAVTASAPPPEAKPAELPRTGAAASRQTTAGGGLALSLGGLAVMGATAGRRRRRTGV